MQLASFRAPAAGGVVGAGPVAGAHASPVHGQVQASSGTTLFAAPPGGRLTALSPQPADRRTWSAIAGGGVSRQDAAAMLSPLASGKSLGARARAGHAIAEAIPVPPPGDQALHYSQGGSSSSSSSPPNSWLPLAATPSKLAQGTGGAGGGGSAPPRGLVIRGKSPTPVGPSRASHATDHPVDMAKPAAGPAMPAPAIPVAWRQAAGTQQPPPSFAAAAVPAPEVCSGCGQALLAADSFCSRCGQRRPSQGNPPTAAPLKAVESSQPPASRPLQAGHTFVSPRQHMAGRLSPRGGSPVRPRDITRTPIVAASLSQGLSNGGSLPPHSGEVGPPAWLVKSQQQELQQQSQDRQQQPQQRQPQHLGSGTRPLEEDWSKSLSDGQSRSTAVSASPISCSPSPTGSAKATDRESISGSIFDRDGREEQRVADLRAGSRALIAKALSPSRPAAAASTSMFGAGRAGQPQSTDVAREHGSPAVVDRQLVEQLQVAAGAAEQVDRKFDSVFLLPNVMESDEFMQVVFDLFSEAQDSVTETSKVLVQSLTEPAEYVQVALQQLGPVDALEDVQRRARRVQSRKAVTSTRRNAGQRARFLPVHGLPKVEDSETACSTAVVYLVRPFESAKDIERQLGPILIIEASYQGTSHTHVPHRLVVALEDPADSGLAAPPSCENTVRSALIAAASISHRGSSAAVAEDMDQQRPLGVFGSSVLERLRSRGVDLPVVSVERRSFVWHAWLLRQLGALQSSRPVAPSPPSLQRAGGTATKGISSVAAAKKPVPAPGASSGGSPAADSAQAVFALPSPQQLPPTLMGRGLSQGGALGTANEEMPSSEQHDGFEKETAAPFAYGSLPLAASGGSSPSPRSPPPRPRSSSRRAQGASPHARDRLSPKRPGSGSPNTGIRESPSMPAATHSAKAERSRHGWHAASAAPSQPAQESGHAAKGPDVGAGPGEGSTTMQNESAQDNAPSWSFRSSWAWADGPSDALAAREDAGGAGHDDHSLQASQRLAAPQSDSSADGRTESQDDDKSEAASKAPPDFVPSTPIIQVGDSSFCLPAPSLAVERVAELWRPGATMVVITTEHYGTPLFCPGGDISEGLINLAPSQEGSQQLVPLYWQNMDETKGAEDEEPGDAKRSNSGSPQSGNGTLGSLGSGISTNSSRWKRAAGLDRVSRTPTFLPTHLEEDEEADADDD
eukprot:TRINITY_DN31686_c0_g2_i1.p1 TRINITY_DN31686_c0_g2~~TRINITY_DN31686_c0_g2_i1.p1  ORF type:complete len:1189 (+),score=217.43 TRINITY_DN31686_c0_g2_i1:62-3628(+)